MTSLAQSDRLFVQAEGNLVSDMNGEKVMMSILNGKYYNLGTIGGRIWELIASPRSARQIVELLMTEYEVEEGPCKDQVERFIQTLLDEQLVQFAEAPTA